MRKRPVDEPFLLAPTTANHMFERRAPIYIKSHGRMIPRFRAWTKNAHGFIRGRIKRNYTALATPIDSRAPFTILFDPRDSRSSAALVLFSCARLWVVCRKTIEK